MKERKKSKERGSERERQKPLEEEAEEGADKETSFRRWMVSFWLSIAMFLTVSCFLVAALLFGWKSSEQRFPLDPPSL